MATTDIFDLTKRLPARPSFGGLNPPTTGAPSCLLMGLNLKFYNLSFSAKQKHAGEFEVAAHHYSTTIPSSSSTAERKEAKAVLTSFLRKQGFSYPVAARIVNRSNCFIDNLILKLHSLHKDHYLGREPANLEIRGALIPYLESLLEEHGDTLIDFIKNFPDPSGTVRAASTSPINCTNSSSLKARALARVSQFSSDGLLPEHVRNLVDLGIELDHVKNIVCTFPSFAYYSLDRKIKPLVEFLLELGVKQSDIPSILIKRPQLLGLSISENRSPQ